MKRVYCKENQDYGIVGEATEVKGIFVGDIVVMTRSNNEKMYSVICESNGHYFVYGWKPVRLETAIITYQMEKVHDYKEVDQELLRKCKHLMFIR